MTKQAVTRKDVARRAGVSETIVSYVLNNNRYVEKGKRERVLQAVKELNYQPNRIARALKGKKTNHIVFIADNISTEHFSQLIDVMDYHAYSKGYLISLIANRNDDDFVSQVISRQCDGIIVSSLSIPESYLHQFVAAGLAVVVLQNRNYQDLTGAAVIHTGLYNGAREGVRFLAGQGRRHILYVDRFSTHGHFSGRGDYRLHGYYDEMEAVCHHRLHQPGGTGRGCGCLLCRPPGGRDPGPQRQGGLHRHARRHRPGTARPRGRGRGGLRQFQPEPVHAPHHDFHRDPARPDRQGGGGNAGTDAQRRRRAGTPQLPDPAHPAGERLSAPAGPFWGKRRPIYCGFTQRKRRRIVIFTKKQKPC